jgi:uncharacterized protein with von Willebrand factor type A (vWA) domain
LTVFRRWRSRGWSYGPWDDGPDPLAPPFGASEAMEALSERVLDGMSPAEALRDLLRRGAQGRRGLDQLRRMTTDRMRRLREGGPMDATLQRVRELLQQALEQERQSLELDPQDAARLSESELADLPRDTAGAVRELKDRQWHSSDAAQTFAQIQDLLRREVLDQQFQGLRDSLAAMGTPEGEAAMQQMREAMAHLAALLEAHARGEDTSEQFAEWMEEHGELLGEDRPETVEELIEALARRRAAAERLLRGLSADQRGELAGLAEQVMQDLGLSLEQARLDAALRQLRPDLFSPSRWERFDGGGEGEGQGLGDATTALEELAELEGLAAAMDPDRPGATIDDVDPERVAQLLGRDAVDDLRALQELERSLRRDNLLQRNAAGELTLSPRAVRVLAAQALKRVFSQVQTRGRGDHDVHCAGAAGEVTGASRPWEFGDTSQIDVVRTVRNAVLRGGPGTPVSISPEDLEVVETESRSGACVCLLVDTSYSMLLRDTWAAAKTTALALHGLATTQHPQDRMFVIAFSAYAREVSPVELASLKPDEVKGTNLQHALHLARRRLAAHPDLEPVILVITDGEPTAHLQRDGQAWFDWPPAPETIELTLAEVERVTRAGATINVFMLADDPGLLRFVEAIAARNGGRVLSPDPARLGQYVVADYLRARRGRRGRAA